MVYADVPEHEGIADGTAPEKAPRPISTDEWLARISDQLQVFVDAIQAAQEDDDQDDSGDPADVPADPKADEKADPKKTTPAKRAEVKGD